MADTSWLDEAPDAAWLDEAPDAEGQDAAPAAAEPAPEPGPSSLDKVKSLAVSLGRGAGQGISGGFGDELAGLRAKTGGNTILSAILGSMPWTSVFAGTQAEADAAQPADGKTRYEVARDRERAANEAAREANPKAYLGGEVLGGAAPAVLTGGGSAASAGAGTLARVLPTAGKFAAQGAAQGLGYSDESTASGLARDTALGGALGVAGGAIGTGLGKAFSSLASKGRGVVTRAGEKAAELADEAKRAEQGVLTSKFGGLRQTENKAIRNLLDLERAGLIDAENAAKLESYRQSGRLAEALNETAKNDLEFLATRTPEVAAAKKAMQEGAEALPSEIERETARQLSAKMARQQFAERFKRYALPVAGSAAGLLLGGPAGASIGWLAGAGSRPTTRALIRMAKHPAVASRLGAGLETAGEAGSAAFRGAARLSPVAAAILGVPAIVGDEEEEP